MKSWNDDAITGGIKIQSHNITRYGNVVDKQSDLIDIEVLKIKRNFSIISGSSQSIDKPKYDSVRSDILKQLVLIEVYVPAAMTICFISVLVNGYLALTDFNISSWP